MATYKINYFRQFQDADKNGKLFINTEEYDFDGIFDTIKDAEKKICNIAGDLNRYPGVNFGYDADRRILWAEDNIYGEESWEIVEA